MNDLPVITIAAPIRNRAYILDLYLEHISDLNYPKKKINLYFLINDSTDNSKMILNEFKRQNSGQFHGIIIDTYNRNVPEDNREFYTRGKYIYTHLSMLKNHIMHKARSDYVLFLDSDILVPPDIINNLLKHKKDIISALIWNGYLTTLPPYTYPNIMFKKSDEHYHHIVNRSIKSPDTHGKLVEVDLTGAVIMLSKRVYKSIKYGFHPQGEDAYFCKMAQDNGYKIYCDTSIFCNHIMNENILREYLNEKESNTLPTHS